MPRVTPNGRSFSTEVADDLAVTKWDGMIAGKPVNPLACCALLAQKASGLRQSDGKELAAPELDRFIV